MKPPRSPRLILENNAIEDGETFAVSRFGLTVTESDFDELGQAFDEIRANEERAHRLAPFILINS
ncbi:MAG TPA: hypothetical protein VF572_05870 [Candidatus Saccharimonadales bacterium]|jgi:ribosome biogenesis protein Tsr3